MKGSITKRGKASWRIKFDLQPGPDGKRQSRFVTVRGGKKDAQQKLAELLVAVGKGAYVDPSRLTVADHVSARIGVWQSAGEIGAHTLKRYNDTLELHVRPHIGRIALQKLSTLDVETWHKQLRPRLSPRSIRAAHRLLSKALADGVRHSLITHNVAGREGQRAPKVPREEVTIIKKGEIDNVVVKLRGTPIYAQAMVALFCGLRIGEICALRWGRIDLDRKTIDVREAVEEVAGEPLTTKGPKTEAGLRKVTMPDVVVDALRDHRRVQLETRMALGQGRMQDDTLVFPAGDGDLKRPTNLSRTWRRIGAADVNFHALRHTHASQLIANKLDIVMISRRLGHSSPAITLSIYAHLFDEDDSRAADAINESLGASSVPKKAG
ncbi:MAG: site-specific integrase [Rhodospirillaceae bacterium]|nr:site-specific integrase [Rhodospirillaceae bacterium]